MLDVHSTAHHIAAKRPVMAVWAIGAIEQHGRHLPIGTDWIAVDAVARRVADELDAWLVPSIPFSLSECHGDIPGTVSLKPATLAAVLRDVVRSLMEQGIHQVLVLNGHGGNFVLEPAIQAINHEWPSVRVVMPTDVWAITDDGEALFETAEHEVHGGEAETSVMLYLDRTHVKAERVDATPPVGREYLDYVTLDRLSRDGVWGSPSHADAAKGERALAAQVRAVVAFARQAPGAPS